MGGGSLTLEQGEWKMKIEALKFEIERLIPIEKKQVKKYMGILKRCSDKREAYYLSELKKHQGRLEVLEFVLPTL
jgi:hypothetical protein